MADGPPLIRDFADPAEPDTLYRKLHARAYFMSIFFQTIDIYMIFTVYGYSLKLGQALYRLKCRLLFRIVCKGVKQSLSRIGAASLIGRTNPLICRLVNRAEAATSQCIRGTSGFADPLAPNLYRQAENRADRRWLHHLEEHE